MSHVLIVILVSGAFVSGAWFGVFWTIFVIRPREKDDLLSMPAKWKKLSLEREAIWLTPQGRAPLAFCGAAGRWRDLATDRHVSKRQNDQLVEIAERERSLVVRDLLLDIIEGRDSTRKEG